MPNATMPTNQSDDRDSGTAADAARFDRPTEVGAGTWFRNPATGEIARLRVGPADTAGRRIEVDLWLQPGGAVAGAHRHAHVIESFEVLAGLVAFRVGDAERRVGRGDGITEVAPGIVHDWWNAGDDTAHVRVEVRAAPGAPGRPAARFVGVIEALWSLGALGRVNAKGMPDPLWLAAIGREYRDAIQFHRPPVVVQAALFGPLAALARRTGRDPLAPELHGPLAPCVIADPGEEGSHDCWPAPCTRVWPEGEHDLWRGDRSPSERSDSPAPGSPDADAVRDDGGSGPLRPARAVRLGVPARGP